MLVLGLETSTAQSSVCLATERGAVASATLARGQSHAEFLVPAVAFCLERAGLSIRDVNGVAVSLGPGLYTGMRVGIATAQVLAHARGLPVVGLTSLDLVAFSVRHVRRLICSVIDARRGELFWAFYRSVPGGVQRTSEFRVGPPGKLAGEIESNAEDVLAVGDGALAQRTLLESAGADVASPLFAHPSAPALCELALPRFIREDTQRAEDLRPVYLRTADTRIGWAQRGALRGGKPPESADVTARRS
jgi:tRNA threonylcarbamoyladenosine biosynthesis protein TsaB